MAESRLAPMLARFGPHQIEEFCGLLERLSAMLLTRDGGGSACRLCCAAHFESECAVGVVRGGCPYEKIRLGRLRKDTGEVP